jgi:hypothetical protein
MLNADETIALTNTLAQFHGSDTFTRHGLYQRMLMTEGVVYLAKTANAFWLTDLIASHQLNPRVRAEEFQVWTLYVERNRGKAILTDGNNTTPIVTQEIEHTDFPLPEIALWFIDGTLLLPSEY